MSKIVILRKVCLTIDGSDGLLLFFVKNIFQTKKCFTNLWNDVMKKIFKSFVYAWSGIRFAVKNELNMKIHLSVTVLVVFLGLWLHISTTEWLLCLLCVGLVLSAEIMNTAFETLVDMVSPKKNILAGRTKDLAAGAVLMLSMISIVVGVVIFVPKLLILFS